MSKINPEARWVKFLRDPKNKFAAESIPVFTALYFTAKKLFDFAAENVLDGLITPKGSAYVIGLGLAIIAYASVVKILLVLITYFEASEVPTANASGFARLCKKNNLEIESHILGVGAPGFGKQRFESFHPCHSNLHLLIISLHESLLKSLQHEGKPLKSADICISFYEYTPTQEEPQKGKCFDLVAFFDPACFEVATERILTRDTEHIQFAGVEAINRRQTVCIHNTSRAYLKGEVKRRKTVKQFFGVPMLQNNVCVGLLNIEIHNKPCFSSNKHMNAFYTEHLYCFRCLFEYQLLKRVFFTLLQDKIVP